MYRWLAYILILGFVLRIVFLNEIQPGPSYDEIQVILNSQSLAKIGQNIPGTVTGILGSVKGDISTGIFSELGSYLPIPWIMLFGMNWPFIKFPFILVNLGMVIFVFLITKKLINEKCALIAALLFTINPWSVYIGRTAYESLPSYFFYLVAIYVFISQKGWRLLFALPALFLGFLTYFAAKVQFPFLLLLGVILSYKPSKKNLKPLVVILALGSLFFVLYFSIFITSPASLRVNETNAKSSLSEIVDSKRRTSIPSSLGKFADNKLTEQLRERAKAYLGTLSPNFLFLEGHSWAPDFLIISDHGPMYLIDFPLIILGLIALVKFYPKALYIILPSIFIAIFPSAVSLASRNYIIRAGLLYPFLTILSAVGVWFFTLVSLPKIFKKTLLIFVAVLYTFSFFIFLNQYFFRTPIDKSEGWNLHSRLLSNYLKLGTQASPDQKYTVVVNDLNGISYMYLLFSNSYQSTDQIKKVNSILANKSYDFGQVEFINTCPKSLKADETLISEAKLDCKFDEKYEIQIASLKDGGGKYHIFNDRLCGKGITNYPIVNTITDLNIEKMSKKEFCEKWVTNPS